jgi:16S rRNA methyltransferase RsmB/F
LTATAEDYSSVTSILLDPSCSGSGLYGRNTTTDAGSSNNLSASSCDDERLQKLSGFQITALRHSLTSFPNVHTVVYSTCSIHEEENECVVAAVLSPDVRKNWRLVAPPCLASWPRRGKNMDNSSSSIDADGPALTTAELECLIRTNHEDATNGFFVACFQRMDCPKSQTVSKSPKKIQRIASEFWWKDPNQHCNISIYNGEFAQQNETIEVDNIEKKRGDNPRKRTNDDAGLSTSDAGVSTSRTTAKKQQPPTTSGNSVSPPSNGTDTVPSTASKKRMKKIEWKRQQHKAKLLRTHK